MTVLYKCDICDAEYDTEGLADECEAGHKEPKEISDFAFDEGKAYPIEISIKFENGDIKTYCLSGSNQETV